MICPTGEAKYFCKGDSTDPFSASPSGKSLPMKQLAPAGAQALIDALIVEQSINRFSDSEVRIISVRSDQ
jgi:hypothetical protein